VAGITVAGLLVACSGDDDGGDVRSTTDEGSGSGSASASGSGAGSGSASAPAASGDHPCDVVDVEALDTLVGTPVGEGEPRLAGVNENDVQWEADECQWELEEVIELQVQLVQADDYQAGEVVCPELGGIGSEVTDVDGLGDSAQWEFDSSNGEGKLRACVATGMVTAEVEPADPAGFDEATLRSIATELVEPTLALV
jgi:hypothetical protein